MNSKIDYYDLCLTLCEKKKFVKLLMENIEIEKIKKIYLGLRKPKLQNKKIVKNKSGKISDRLNELSKPKSNFKSQAIDADKKPKKIKKPKFYFSRKRTKSHISFIEQEKIKLLKNKKKPMPKIDLDYLKLEEHLYAIKNMSKTNKDFDHTIKQYEAQNNCKTPIYNPKKPKYEIKKPKIIISDVDNKKKYEEKKFWFEDNVPILAI